MYWIGIVVGGCLVFVLIGALIDHFRKKAKQRQNKKQNEKVMKNMDPLTYHLFVQDLKKNDKKRER